MIKPSPEHYFEKIFAVSDNGIFFVDSRGEILRINPAFSSILGYAKEEIVGKPLSVLTHKTKDSMGARMTPYSPLHHLLISENEDLEKLFYDRNNSPIALTLRSIILRDDNETVNGAIGVLKTRPDLSDSVPPDGSLQEKIWEGRQNFENLLNYSADTIVVCDTNGTVITANKSFLDLVNHNLADVVGKHIAEFTPYDIKRYQISTGEELVVDKNMLEKRAEAAAELYEKGVKLNWNTYYLRSDDIAVPVEINASVLKDSEDHRRGSILIGREVTQRHVVESELKSYRLHLEELVKARTAELQKVNEELQADIIVRRQAQEYLNTVLQTAKDGIITADTNGIVLSWNRAAEELYGYTPEEIIGQPSSILTVPEARAMQQKVVSSEHRFRDPASTTSLVEGIGLRKDGSTFFAELSISVSKINDMANYTVIARDVSDRKAKEEELRRLRNYLKNIIDSMPSALVGVDKDGLVTQWNVGAETLTGVVETKAVGRPLDAVLPHFAGKMNEIKKAMAERTASRGERIVKNKGGENRFEDITVYPLIANGIDGAVVRIDDVTERVRLEDMMVQSEKMLSVGGLAAGMAHEINNPLAGILQSAQVMQNRISGNLAANKSTAEACDTTIQAIEAYMTKRGILNMVEAIIESGQRASKIVENMLSFSRKSGDVFELHDLAELLDSAIELAEKDYDLERKYDFRKIEIIKDYDPDLPQVTFERNKVQQVVLNLLRNGAYAMSLVEDDRKPTFIIRLKRDGNMARIEVEDNGTGMDEDVRKRVFEPFFTTKAEGIGTGLGLSVSYFIITENHRGTMEVASTPGRGTTFVIRLPLES